MRKTREEKAITLIALIITIVVLLILAVVAINAVTGDGIIQHATNAKTEYEQAQAEENKTLSYYEAYLNANGQVGKWIQKEVTKTVTDLDGNKVEVKASEDTITKVNSDGTVQEIKIGSYVNYDATDLKDGVQETETIYISKQTETGVTNQTFSIGDGYNSGWKVLGIEDGKILLISAASIKNYEVNAGQLYLTGETELNNICKIYGNGKGAESARSVKVEDINKLTGYVPEILKYESEGWGKYGVTTIYTFDGTNLSYTTSEGETDIYSTNRLVRIVENEWIGEEGLNKGETYKVTNSNYVYTGEYYSADMLSMNMDKNSMIYKMLFISPSYWLASKCVSTKHSEELLAFNLRFVTNVESGAGAVSNCGASGTTDSTYVRGVRPIVILDASVDLVLSSDGTSYDIKL